MSEMVERVAKAMKTWKFAAPMLNGYRICGRVEDGDTTHFPWKTFPTADEARAELDRLNARAAIEAMREPTEAMVNAYCRLEDAEGVSGLVSADAWQAMIDAALNPGDRT